MTPGPPGWFAIAQLMPDTTDDANPAPLQSRTRIATIVAPFATPNDEPATVPATCVPCPLQSSVPRPSSIADQPGTTRPERSE